MSEAGHRTGTRRRVAGVFLMSAFAITLRAGTASAQEQTAQPVQVTVEPTQIYTDTGITVNAGDTVRISASGRIHFGGGRISSLEPTGIPRGPDCDVISANQPRSTPWPAPAFSCWSLIGKVKGGRNFEIGSDRTFQPKISGELSLGVNDNFVEDNSGRWIVDVTVTPTSTDTTTPTTEPEGTPPATKNEQKSSSPLPLIVGVIAVLAAGFFLFRFLAGRRRNDDDDGEPAVVAPPLVPPENPYATMANTPAPVSPPIEPVAAAAVLAPAIGSTPSAPPEPESIDVNIFEVEFTNGLTLRVGYNHFPEGTHLQWRVTQNRIPVSSGHFVTKGGGSTNHFETVPLGVKLESRAVQPDGADVQFDWNVNGVPFRYSVRRDPNC